MRSDMLFGAQCQLMEMFDAHAPPAHAARAAAAAPRAHAARAAAAAPPSSASACASLFMWWLVGCADENFRLR